MPRSRPIAPPERKPSRYHHGDLPRAMLLQAVRTIQDQGVEALTLRGVAAELGVSRTALYRHFTDKQALLGAVAAEGFRLLTAALLEAWEGNRRGRAGFDAMGVAYVHFAVAHPSHYRVMFGGVIRTGEMKQAVAGRDTDAFQVLVDAITEQQRNGLVRDDDPQQLALYIWAVVHGVAMLALDGMLPPQMPAESLISFVNARMQTGIAP